MNAFALRLEPGLDKKLDRYCKSHGYKKTGLILALLRRFLTEKNGENKGKSLFKTKAKGFKKLVGVVSLGGDAVADAEEFFK